jgi:hypothetical protein
MTTAVVADPDNDVFIIGAGFSRAVSRAFFLTNDLGKEAVEAGRIPARDEPPEGTRFEAWLSRLAEERPYRSTEENVHARALFLRLGAAIAKVVAGWERDAFSSLPPAWLEDLLSVLHARRSTIISFNYDHILEAAVAGHCLEDRGSRRPVRAADILGRLPPCAPTLADEERTYPVVQMKSTWDPREELVPADWMPSTFRLLKLHGSLSWYWDPDDQIGLTLQRWRIPGCFGSYDRPDEAARRRSLPGRVPFVVPPTTTKSAYLTNLVSRELWSTARESLRSASRLILLGYSLPAEDAVVSGLLAETLADRHIAVVVADLEPGPVSQRLRDLGLLIDSDESREFRGEESIEHFVAWHRDDVAERALARLRNELEPLIADGPTSQAAIQPLEGQIGVRWGHCSFPGCGFGSPPAHSLALDSSRPPGPDSTGTVLTVPVDRVGFRGVVDQTQVPHLAKLVVGSTQLRRLVVRDPTGRSYPVIDYQLTSPTSRPAGTAPDPGRHLTLFPAGHPRPTMAKLVDAEGAPRHQPVRP